MGRETAAAVKARRQPVSGRRHPPHTINPCAPDWGRRNGSYRARPIGEAEKSVIVKRRHTTRRYTRRAHGLAPPVSCRIFLAVLQSVLVEEEEEQDRERAAITANARSPQSSFLDCASIKGREKKKQRKKIGPVECTCARLPGAP